MLALNSYALNDLSSTPSTSVSLIGVTDLASVLIQCFALILAGYFCGRFGLITDTASKGLTIFVTYFSLPALIFNKLAESDLSDMRWILIISIFLSKAIIFLVVAFFTGILTKPRNVGKAGLYAIFATQSNDFALGYPLLSSLYHSSHPQFARYLYVLAPIQLVVLNPIGLLLMEIQKYVERRSSTDSQEGFGWLMMKSVLKSIFKNPIIVMTVLGIGWNLLFNHNVPTLISPFLDVLSDAFSATALFLLGLNLVGKLALFNGTSVTLLVPLILVMTKILVFPILTRTLVSNLMNTNTNETLELSNFGFLYGTFPSAPTVFIFALQYEMPTAIVASGMVLSTILSAPLMFVSANMIRIADGYLPFSAFQEDLGTTMCYAGLLSAFCVSWVILVFICGYKWKSVTHRCTLALCLSQLFVGIGGHLWQYLDKSSSLNRFYLTYHLQYIFAVGGTLSARIWTAMIAITLVLLHWRSLCFVIRVHNRLSIFAGVLTVFLSCLTIYLALTQSNENIDPNFEFGSIQAYIAVFILLASLIVTVSALVIQQHLKTKLIFYQSVSVEEDPQDSPQPDSPQPETTQADANENIRTRSRRSRRFSGKSPCSHNESVVVEVEDLVADPLINDFCPASINCSMDQRKQCAHHIKRYRDQIQEANEATSLFDSNRLVDRYSSDYHQVFHHVLLLLTLLLSMLVGLTVSVGKIVLEKPSGIFIELEFLDILLNYGQGVITFLIFGLETTSVCDQINKLFCNKRGDSNHVLKLPEVNQLEPSTKQICDQFVSFHKESCIKDIVFEYKVGAETHNIFRGKNLIDWLIAAGLAQNRKEAESYGRHLLNGRVIEHITNIQHFHDGTFLYKFICPKHENIL